MIAKRASQVMFLVTFLFALPALSAQAWAGGSAVKARLYSSNASEEASGTLTLDGYNLSGHLTGGGIDVTVSGVVKSNSVDVVVTGHIVPSCNLNRQSMSNNGSNQGTATSITMDFNCTTKAGGVGQDYLFRLDLALPSSHLQVPSDSGENANSGAQPSGEIQGNPA